MAKITEDYKIYQIPENFLQEGYVFQGRVAIRSIIDMIIVCFPFLLAAIFVDWNFGARLWVFGGLAAPFAILALSGIDDEPLTEIFVSALLYRKEKNLGIQKYDPNPAPFYQSPTDVLLSDKIPMDELVGIIEERRHRRLEKKLSREYVEGKNFTFAEDHSISRYKAMPRISMIPSLRINGEAEDLTGIFHEEEGEEQDDQ